MDKTKKICFAILVGVILTAITLNVTSCKKYDIPQENIEPPLAIII